MSDLQQAADELETTFADRAAWGAEFNASAGTIHLGLYTLIEAGDVDRARAILGRRGYQLTDWRIEITDDCLHWHMTARPAEQGKE